MNRYYNENPQVALWKEKYKNLEEGLGKDVKCWQAKCLTLQQQLDIANEELNYYKKELSDAKVRALALFNLETDLLIFNELPWYKKIFYKFKL